MIRAEPLIAKSGHGIAKHKTGADVKNMTYYMQLPALRFTGLFFLSFLLLSACSIGTHQDSAPQKEIDVAHIPDAVPRPEPRSAGGNPDTYSVLGRTYRVMSSHEGYVERGIASWYGTKFHGRTTSNGEIYSMYKMTAAHTRLPLPSYVQVTNLENGRSIIVRVNDRGPFHPNRIIDLSYVAAKKLGIASKGTGLVEVRSIDPHTWDGSLQPPPRQRSSYPATVNSSNTLFIQAGAFSSRQNAEQLQQRLRALMPSRSVQLAFADTDQLYRVRIGPLQTVEEADKLAEVISNNGYPDPYVVIE